VNGHAIAIDGGAGKDGHLGCQSRSFDGVALTQATTTNTRAAAKTARAGRRARRTASAHGDEPSAAKPQACTMRTVADPAPERGPPPGRDDNGQADESQAEDRQDQTFHRRSPAGVAACSSRMRSCTTRARRGAAPTSIRGAVGPSVADLVLDRAAPSTGQLPPDRVRRLTDTV
jgi:hypothetical protein